MESRDNLRKLLEDFPLYKKIEIGQDLVDPDKLNGIGFNYHCETCNKETTQKLHFYRSGIPGFSKKIKSTLYPEELVDPSTNLFELTQLFETICNYCQNKSGIIVIQGNSNKNITDPYHKVFFQKIGQYPSFNSNANKRTLSVLTKKKPRIV